MTSRCDSIESLFVVKSEKECFETCVSVARDLGFEYCCYGMIHPLRFRQPKVVLISNYPVKWQHCYDKRKYLEIDPTFQHGLRSALPAVWSDEFFATAKELWREARTFGLRVGWLQSSRDANGIQGLLTVARSSEPLSDSELQDKTPKLSWLAKIVHSTMSQCLVPKFIPEVEVKLSRREVEILGWTAEGKTSSEVADIINISERTVNFHVNSAMLKLNAPSKCTATIRAAVLELLS